MEAEIQEPLITVTVRLTRAEAAMLRAAVADKGDPDSPAGRLRRLLDEGDD